MTCLLFLYFSPHVIYLHIYTPSSPFSLSTDNTYIVHACMHVWSLLTFLSLHIFWQLLCLQHALLYACIIPSHHFLSLYIQTTYMCCSMFFFMHVLMFEVYIFSIYAPVAFTNTVVCACTLAVSQWCRASTGVLPLFLFSHFFLPTYIFLSWF